ncbi:MAG: DNA-binding protein [Nitrosopumilaceae archaeon]|nr:DNA-binding protein [Nitrosopumilaceae archaeon]NIU00727.1 DNA-binding protein [Nitrosopumilaceae archaeon]NIU87159.1 DNA-binding protein [Nitrosopumilaceae archaeon]NIV65686.1 DNA-binding protein [Nitrosopumilaceae archaeon]NIX61329.1 DNA-binding protein [Nitrosopumilaceae archaeon]
MEMHTTEQAKNMRGGVNIQGKVERKGEPRTVNMRSGGTIDVCDAFIVDEEGEIKLTLWGDDIQKVNDGDIIKITNGYTNSFKGEVSVTKGKFGQMEVVT